MTRPFADQGFHEVAFLVWPYVDPIWRDVARLVSRGWCAEHPVSAVRTPPRRCGTRGPLDIVRMRSVLVVRDEYTDLYVRAGKRMRVYGPDLKCISVDSNGECTYVRDRRMARSSAFFRVDRGRSLRVVFRGQ